MSSLRPTWRIMRPAILLVAAGAVQILMSFVVTDGRSVVIISGKEDLCHLAKYIKQLI